MNTLKQALVRDVARVSYSSSALLAAKALEKSDQGAVIVIGARSEFDVIGIITEHDLVTRIILRGRNATQVTAVAIMSAPVICVDVGTSLAQCARVMEDNEIRHLGVREEERFVGLVSARDLLIAQTTDQLDQLRSYEEYVYRYR